MCVMTCCDDADVNNMNEAKRASLTVLLAHGKNVYFYIL